MKTLTFEEFEPVFDKWYATTRAENQTEAQLFYCILTEAEERKGVELWSECPECGTVILPTGFGAHHAAVCKYNGHNFKSHAPTPDREEGAYWIKNLHGGDVVAWWDGEEWKLLLPTDSVVPVAIGPRVQRDSSEAYNREQLFRAIGIVSACINRLDALAIWPTSQAARILEDALAILSNLPNRDSEVVRQRDELLAWLHDIAYGQDRAWRGNRLKSVDILAFLDRIESQKSGVKP